MSASSLLHRLAGPILLSGLTVSVLPAAPNQDPPPPRVGSALVKNAPAAPAGTILVQAKGPGKYEPSETCTVLQWNGLTYWAFSARNNSYSVVIAAFDAQGRMVKSWPKDGTRYTYRVTVESRTQTATWWGQDDTKVVIPWRELAVVAGPEPAAATPPPAGPARGFPNVVDLPRKSHPPYPEGMHAVPLDAGKATYPVLQWNGVDYWAFSFENNSTALGIVAYNREGQVLRTWRKGGTRYLQKITVDARARTVTFWGQGDTQVTMPWDELAVAATAAPTPPPAPKPAEPEAPRPPRIPRRTNPTPPVEPATASRPAPKPNADVSGNWEDGNHMSITITQDGARLRATMNTVAGHQWWSHAEGTVRENQIEAMQHFRGKDPGERVTGVVTNPNRIDWSNGTAWVRAGVSLAGKWRDPGNHTIRVTHRGERLTATMESPEGQVFWTTARGSIDGSRITSMLHLQGNKPGESVTGRVLAGGKKIEWSNGTTWTRME